MKLHVINALMTRLLILIFKYLSGVLLSVHDILQVCLRHLQLVHSCLKLCTQLNTMSDYNKVPQSILDSSAGNIPLFFWCIDLLPNQVVALRLHFLYYITVLGEGSI
jgi:hypothetical protein